VSDRRRVEALVAGAVPYSKGLMAHTLLGIGLSPERAYELARLIERELAGGEAVPSGTLLDIAASVVAAHEGERALRRLRALRTLIEGDVPLIVLVGGATGTGKSTLTTELAHRLGITRVTSTDFVRQTMRAFFSLDVMPSIHYSSFEAGQAVVDAGDDRPSDLTVRGFVEQTRNVLVGVRAVLERALTEHHSLALEGVHILPGLVPADLDGAIVFECVLKIEDEEQHASHFRVRDLASGGLRPLPKYLRALPEIRRIQDYLVKRAEQAGVPVIDNIRLQDAVQSVIGHLLAKVETAGTKISGGGDAPARPPSQPGGLG
jgi:2-phosphoglycerate kinase